MRSGGFFEREVRRRRFPVVGRGSGVFSFIHVDDAADATVAAVERGAPGIYNVVDDEPAPMREWLPVYARGDRREAAVAGAALPGAARWQASTRRQLATDLRGASNERAKAELGWQPRHASWRQGFRDALGLVAGVLAPQLLHALGPRAHRLVAELPARAGDVDRALLRREPVGEARDRRVAGAAQQAPDALRGRRRDARDRRGECCGRAASRPVCRAAR